MKKYLSLLLLVALLGLISSCGKDEDDQSNNQQANDYYNQLTGQTLVDASSLNGGFVQSNGIQLTLGSDGTFNMVYPFLTNVTGTYGVEDTRLVFHSPFMGSFSAEAAAQNGYNCIVLNINPQGGTNTTLCPLGPGFGGI